MSHGLLWHVAPRAFDSKAVRQREIIGAISPLYASTLAAFEIDNRLRVAHFTAQIAHESDGFCTTVEYASGAAYEGRADLGNIHPGDGMRYKGRGLIQLTGRANYERARRELGVDLVSDPTLAAEPVLSLKIACLYWRWRYINHWADRDDIRGVTKRVNGGYNGLSSRQHYLARAQDWLAEDGVLTFTPEHRSEGWWQRVLAKLGL